MDIATLIGIIGSTFLVLLGAWLGGLEMQLLLDIPSTIITFGGGTMATIISSPLSTTLSIFTPMKIAFFPTKFDVKQLIISLVSFSEKARREGLLALEDDITDLDDEFMKKGIQLVVDGTDPELVTNILETDLENIESRHKGYIGYIELAAGLYPAFGMIGTLTGLIQMLRALGADVTLIGRGMAVAIITTFYGAMLANGVLIPLAKKLASVHGDEVAYRQVTIQGVLSIQQGDNPRIVKEKLSSYLSTPERAKLNEEESEK